MNYWLIALPKERLEFCMKKGIFGLNRKYILPKTQVGDKVVFYATKIHKIVGFGEITEAYYEDGTAVFTDKKLFPTGDIFPDRIKFEAESIAAPVDFIQVIDKMSFIKNLANWQIHFRSAIVQITKSDWETVTSLVHSASKP